MKYLIYHIKSRIDNRFYVGSTINSNDRWGLHKRLLYNGKHHNHQLQHFYNKYGFDALEFIVIAECEDEQEMMDCEQWMLDHNYGTKDCINENPFADRPPSQKGKKLSIEVRKKMSETWKGKPKPWLIGRGLSTETKNKISQSKQGHKASIETRHKLSKIHKGKSPSKETRQKISEALRGKKHSTDTKKKISDAHKGQKFSFEIKQKISDALKRFWRNKSEKYKTKNS